MANRFYFPDRLFKVQNNGNLLAFMTFVDNETGLEYRGWKLLSGQNGIFVGPPSDKPYTPEGQTKTVFPDFVKVAYDAKADNNRNVKGVKWFKELTEAAHAKYDQLSGNVASPSAVGPVQVAAGVSSDEPDEDDLPF